METGNLAKWHKEEGEYIEIGDVLAEVETDKATVDFEMQDEGFIAKILIEEGSQGVELGAEVAILVEEEDDIAAFADYKPTEGAAPEKPTEPKPTPVVEEKTPEPVVETPKAKPAAPAAPKGGRVFASPLARKTAEGAGVEISTIGGTGPNGRIIHEDVLAYLASGAEKAPAATPSMPAPLGEYEDMEISQVRKIIAERLVYSKQNIPHYYTSYDCEVDNMLKVRARLNDVSESKISVNDFILKAASLACTKVSECNSQWHDDFIREFKNVDMCVAVQTDSGLITPIVKYCNLKGLEEIATEVKELAGRARKNKLKPEEF